MVVKLKNKLRSRAGESLAEVLVALLISALGIMILAIMISAANSIVMESKFTTDRYIEADNLLAEQSGTGTAGQMELKLGDDAVKLSDDSSADQISITCFTNETFTNMPVTAYKGS